MSEEIRVYPFNLWSSVFYITALLFFFAGSSFCYKSKVEAMSNSSQPGAQIKKYNYLALGDSYTIGETVPLAENFPHQTASLFKTHSTELSVRIIAKTGWTTDELEAGIVESNSIDPLLSSYDFVSLLIGVNNQYRGRTVENYKPEFEALLQKAIRYAGGRPGRVVVLSIPDWGATPFATGRDRAQIAAEIDAYNAAKKQISLQHHVHYIDITSWTREAANDPTLLAADGLHPSGKEYKRWAEQVAIFFRSII
ncbi:MAG TPA: SGNH/GDSL hydrolase family protein [Chitinophagaceae bacterium]